MRTMKIVHATKVVRHRGSLALNKSTYTRSDVALPRDDVYQAQLKAVAYALDHGLSERETKELVLMIQPDERDIV